MKRYRNNQGMAMVTVLIAITFIGILATSLMYMSYMNYVAKSMRYSSTDNFYTAEYGLAELATALQNQAANKQTVTDALNSFKTEYVSPTTLTIIDSDNKYNCEALRALLQNSTQEAVIEVSSKSDRKCNLTSSSIQLMGVVIKATTSDGYVSTISTDIDIEFSSTSGAMDVNDFSLITDSPVTLNNKNVSMGGNVFIGSGDGDTALSLKNISVCSILGNQGIIAGDIYVQKGSTLVITGTMTVYGKITIEDGATFICTGELHHTKAFNASGGAIVRGISKTHAAEPDLAGTGLTDDKLASAILTSVYVQGKEDEKLYEMTVGTAYSTYKLDYNNGYKQTNPDTGKEMKVFIGTTSPISNTLNNSLLLIDRSAYSGSETTNIRAQIDNSSIVSVTPVEFYDDYTCLYLKTMSDEDYEFAKRILVGTTGSEQIGGGAIHYTCENGVADFALTKAAANGTHFNTETGKNRIAAGLFIAENSSNIISSAFAATQGEASPEYSTVSYKNWNKE